MAKRTININNGNGGFAWTTRPVNKMNNKDLAVLGKYQKKFAKKYASKKRRVHLKNDKV